MSRFPLAFFVLLPACIDGELDKTTGSAEDPTVTDADRDGVVTAEDCDDEDPAVFPGATEACDGADQDCDGVIDEDSPDAPFWYLDADGDGYGTDAAVLAACEAPEGYGAFSTDCDDADPGRNPGLTEVCDAADLDEDCDGLADDADPDGADGLIDWYFDADADGYGTGFPVSQCEAPASAVDLSGDCDDGGPLIHPGADEVCGGVDEDCDGETDEAGAVGETATYQDVDLDGFGDPGSALYACEVPLDGLFDGTDCDDTDPAVYPGAPEWCDGVRNDCDDASASFEDNRVSFIDPSGVWTDVSSDFDSATTTAVVAASGTYQFCPGTYYTRLLLNSKTTSFVGLYGADVTTLSNTGTTGAVVTVVNGAVTITGLTLTGGKGNAGYGGAVFSQWTLYYAPPTAANLTIDSCVLEGNTATYGGAVGVYYPDTWVDIVDTVIAGNTATYGGGVYIEDAGVAQLVGSTVSGNVAEYGGALSASDDGRFILTDSTLDGNSATRLGGGVLLDSSTLDLTDSWITGSTGQTGGGMYMVNADVTTTCVTTGGFTENTVTGTGGGVYLDTVIGTSTFVSDGCDFGSGATDNNPNDVYVGGVDTYDEGGAGATFVCTEDGCTP